MTVVRWALKAREYVSCNRAFGCLCEFNSLPTYRNCHQVVPIVDVKASPEQRDALLRTLSDLDTEPEATLFQEFSATFDTITTPSCPKSTLTSTRERRGSACRDGSRPTGEPLRNPVTGEEHRARIHLPNGFEYDVCEVGSGTARTQGPVALVIEVSHAQFARF